MEEDEYDNVRIEEAEEVDELEEDRENLLEEEEEEEGEDLFGDDMFKDYIYNPEDERYDPDLVDDAQYEPLSREQRLAAEKAIEDRERKTKREQYDDEFDEYAMDLNDSLNSIDSKEGMNSNSLIAELIQGTVMNEDGDGAIRKIKHEYDEDEEGINLEDFKTPKGSLAEWLAMEKPRRYVKRRFKQFLTTYENGGYMERIKKMMADNKKSLEIHYDNLVRFEPVLTINLIDEPTEMLKIFDEVANDVVLGNFPDYADVNSDIHIRVAKLPIEDSLRELRKNHLNFFIKVKGVVTRRTSVFPQMTVIKFDCSKCGNIIGPIVLNTNLSQLPKPNSCPECSSKGPFSVNQTLTVFKNYQKITLQESPGSVPAGRIPRSKDVILLDDLIDCVRPGEEVEVTGIYKHSYDVGLNSKQGFPVFSTVIHANHVLKIEDKLSSFSLSEEDKKSIRMLSVEPNLRHKIIRSIAPSIYGHDDIKLAIALSLFGGVQKNAQDGKHRIRGDINLLMVGDPGTAKSQFLKYIEKTAHRAVFTTGKGSTAVGLTAAVRKDPLTREWSLEGGALVLADNGVCLIDEFDKMSDQDRTSIHEAMEQQSISISKAGIVTTLQARCSVIAAANPIKGRYDSSRSFHENVELSDPILSRFDILCVVKDTVDDECDQKLASFVVESHSRSHPDAKNKQLQPGETLDNDSQATQAANATQSSQTTDISQQHELQGDIIPQNLLKRYILYAKQRYNPKCTGMDSDKLTKFYVDMRRESMMNSGLLITVRHIESAIRLAEAHAKMHLRDHVTDEDLNVAISVLLGSFISAQKYSVSKALQRKFKHYQYFQTYEMNA